MRNAPPASAVPLVVDLDGTLTPTDTLIESLLQLAKKSLLHVLLLPLWLLQGRARFKAEIAQRAGIATALLPYRPELLAYLRAEKASGRRVVLATAAHRSIAAGVAGHLGLFDQVLASEDGHNLKGSNKLQAIREQVGERFVYAGDCRADLPIWRAAQAAVLVGVPTGLARQVRGEVAIEREFANETVGLKTWMKALRVHQWLKNLLLFVPLLTAFSFTNLAALATMLWAFLAFSLAASATYIANDLWDLENDRAHPRKRLRPFACARIPIPSGVAMAFGLLAVALGIAFVVSKAFLAMLLLYIVLTSAYSWVLKTYVLIDVIMLSVLYTLRILAGAVAIGVTTSSWLLAFSVFIFLSLALVKRCSELVSLENAGATAAKGRDYRVKDLTVLWPMGVGAALCSVVVFGLFTQAPETQSRYATPDLLWVAGIGLIYWLARLWIKTSRGEMDDDPIIYAIKDGGSRIAVLLMVLVVLVSRAYAYKDLL